MKLHTTESAFTLLEIVVVVGLIALIAVSLGNSIVTQFRVWESNTNLLQIHNQNQLITDYFNRDLEQAVSFTSEQGNLEFNLDVDKDGTKDRQITYEYFPEQKKLKRYSTKPAESISLDGNNDYIAIENMNYQGTNYSEISILAKIKSTADSGILYSFDRSEYFRLGIGASGYYSGAGLEYPAGKLTFEFDDGSRIHDLKWTKDNTLLNDGAVHNLAVVFDNGTVRLYLDGTEEKFNSSNAGAIDSTFGSGSTRYGFVGVGSEASSYNGRIGPDEYFDGNIYWLQQWDRALSKQEINDAFTASVADQTDLALYYDFSGFGGESTIDDLAPSIRGDNQGQAFGITQKSDTTAIVSSKVKDFSFAISDSKQKLTIDWTLESGSKSKTASRTFFADKQLYTGFKEEVLSFDGSASDSDGPDYTAIKKQFYEGTDYSELTLLAKVKTTANQGIIYSFDRSEYFRWAIGSTGGTSGHLTFHCASNSSIHDLNGKSAVNDGKEHILAVVFDNSQVRMYIDGELDKSFSLGESNNNFGRGVRRYGFMGTGSEAEFFDGRKGPAEYFAGDLYWLQHWNKALTEQEIKYYSDSSLLKGNEIGLVAYYNYPDGNRDIFYDTANGNDAIIFGAEVGE